MKQELRRNTDQFATGPFRPHGRIEIWAEGNVMRLEATGPFNKEAIIALGATWRALFAELPMRGPFAAIIVIRHSIMSSQEVLDAFGDFLRSGSQAGHPAAAVAYVAAPDIEGRSLILPKLADLYAATGRLFASFATEAEAEDWMRAWLRDALVSPRAPMDAN